jgi:hypothetical protein
VDAAVQTGLSVTARGAGTGLTGGALGEGLIIDFSRYHRQITDLDLQRGTCGWRGCGSRPSESISASPRVLFWPGRSHEFTCDSWGYDCQQLQRFAHALLRHDCGPCAGTRSGACRWSSRDGRSAHDTLRKQRELVSDLVALHGLEIAERLPPGLLKRRPAYAIHQCASAPDNLNLLLCGSEGTLGLITSAELNIVPLQRTGW